MQVDKSSPLYRLPTSGKPKEEPSRVAQTAEQRPVKSPVVGSTPTPGAKTEEKLFPAMASSVGEMVKEAIHAPTFVNKWWLCRGNLAIYPVVKITHSSLQNDPNHAAIQIFDSDVDWNRTITHRVQAREIVVRKADIYEHFSAADIVRRSLHKAYLEALGESGNIG